MSKQQTAVEWLVEQLINSIKMHQKEINELLQQAKEMEKHQIIDAYLSDRFPCSDEDAEQYYKQTFNTNHE